MAVWYLDSADEITDAVARLRNATDEQVVFVVPPGSRIASGRLNFKLLGREAAQRGLRLAIASPDAQVRAMAASAGVLGLATPAEATAALARGDAAPEAVQPDGAASSSGAETAAGGDGIAVAQGATRWGGRRLMVTVAGVLTVAVVGAVASLQTLPTAEITLAPRTIAVGPLTLTITALPSIAEVDLAARQVPAVEVAIPLSVEGTFPASGSERVEERARGEVVFSAPALEIEQTVPAKTLVRTPAGVEFETTEAVILPRVTEGSSPAHVTVAIEAIEAGEAGNVGPEAISVVPSLEGQGISVRNPAATAGGRFEETPVVTAQDYDRAAADLQNRLNAALETHLRDPANAPPGLTVFTETAQPGEISHQPAADELVGTTASEFHLTGQVAARVLAVDERLVNELAEAALLAEVPAGMAVLPGALSLDTPAAVVDGEEIRFERTAQAQAYQLIDRDDVLARIAGLPVSEARAILEGIGATTVSVWPEFLGDLPGDRNRIRLEVLEPSTSE